MNLSNIKDIKYFAKGKRGVVYIGILKGKKVAIKKSERFDRAKNEAKWLRILNKHNIGPKLISSGKDYIIYEFVKGERILNYFNINEKPQIKKVIKKILRECRKMDKIGINKKEMTNPYKHILINKNKVRMIDFERCYRVKPAKNVTQFCQFLISKKVELILNKKEIKINKDNIIRLSRQYKSKQTEINFDKILKEVKDF